MAAAAAAAAAPAEQAAPASGRGEGRSKRAGPVHASNGPLPDASGRSAAADAPASSLVLDDTFERQQGLSQHALYAAQQLLMLVRPPAHCMQPAAACVLRVCSTRCGKAAKELLEAGAVAAPITAAALPACCCRCLLPAAFPT